MEGAKNSNKPILAFLGINDAWIILFFLKSRIDYNRMKNWKLRFVDREFSIVIEMKNVYLEFYLFPDALSIHCSNNRHRVIYTIVVL